ncbi:MAG: 1-acyl-sn-glycerol-3-phosphate acyltransferase [Pseudomonadota bacterium]
MLGSAFEVTHVHGGTALRIWEGDTAMSDNQVAAPARRSAFLPAERDTDQHIVDTLIEERCPSFAEHWTWPVVRPTLHALLGYRKARHMADRMAKLSGRQAFDDLMQALDVDLHLNCFERLPREGRLIIAANHPTGLADGVAVWAALTQYRQDVVFFANADAIRVNRRFEDVIIPVEWVMEKRSPAKTRETLRRAADAFAQEKCVVIFPSGKLAKMVDGTLTEQDWFSTVIGLAKKQNASVLPLHITAKNSSLFYLLSNLNGELRDITLFYELLNKTRSRFDMTMGPLISPEQLVGDAVETTERLKNYVAYGLKDDPDRPFGE